MTARPPGSQPPSRNPLRTGLIFLGAMLFLFEEWLWNIFNRWFAWMGRHRAIRWTEARLARVPPVVALVILCIPMALLFPFKIVGLWMIATGHFFSGCLVMLAAKVVGTAIIARIFMACRPQLLTMPWFARLHAWTLLLRDSVHAWIERQPAWHATRRAMRSAREHVRAWTRGKSRARAAADGDVRRGTLMRWRTRRRGRRDPVPTPRGADRR